MMTRSEVAPVASGKSAEELADEAAECIELNALTGDELSAYLRAFFVEADAHPRQPAQSVAETLREWWEGAALLVTEDLLRRLPAVPLGQRDHLMGMRERFAAILARVGPPPALPGASERADVKAGAWWYVNDGGGITFSYERESLEAWRGGDCRRFGPGADCYEAEDGEAFEADHLLPASPPPSAAVSEADHIRRDVGTMLAEACDPYDPRCRFCGVDFSDDETAKHDADDCPLAFNDVHGMVRALVTFAVHRHAAPTLTLADVRRVAEAVRAWKHDGLVHDLSDDDDCVACGVVVDPHDAVGSCCREPTSLTPTDADLSAIIRTTLGTPAGEAVDEALMDVAVAVKSDAVGAVIADHAMAVTRVAALDLRAIVDRVVAARAVRS